MSRLVWAVNVPSLMVLNIAIVTMHLTMSEIMMTIDYEVPFM